MTATLTPADVAAMTDQVVPIAEYQEQVDATIALLNGITSRIAHRLNPIQRDTVSWNDVLTLTQLRQADRYEQTPTMSQVAKLTGLSRAAMTACTDRLERLGFVERTPDVVDRRRTTLRITDAGTELLWQTFTFDADQAEADEAAAEAARLEAGGRA